MHPIYLKKKKIIAVSELLDSTQGESPKNAGVYLEISFLDCLTTKKIPGLFQDFSKISAKFLESFQIPGLSRTSQDWWEPWIDLSFQNWHEEFEEFWPEHLKVSKMFLLMGSFWAKKVQRSYFSWNWRGIQNLERNWLVVSRLI